MRTTIHTPQTLLADEIFSNSDLWDLDDCGMEAAASLLKRLFDAGFEVVKTGKRPAAHRAEFDRAVLCALRDAGGQMNLADVKAMYRYSGDGHRVAYLVRHGRAAWVRRDGNVTRPAHALKITEAGISELANEQCEDLK